MSQTALTLDQLRALDTLVQAGLDEPAFSRRAWFDALAIDNASLKTLLERALFPGRSVQSGTFLGSLPDIGTLAQDQGELRPDQVIGPYRLAAMIGEGGSASVWRAHRVDGVMKRDVALKLPYFVGSARGWHERVARERDILAGLQHPNIATIYDAGVEDNGRPWLALELIDGTRIDQFCTQHALETDARVRLLVLVIRALEHAHARGIIHRDIKPANILVTATGQPKLLDFGIAKLLDSAETGADGTPATELTRLHGRPLTPDYASPEQLSGAIITTGTDVYALGVVLYELLTGSRPFETSQATRSGDLASLGNERSAVFDSPGRRQQKLASDTVSAVRGVIGKDLDAITIKALHVDPDKRYRTASAFADDLDRYLREEPVTAQADSQLYRAKQFVRRNKLVVGAASAIAVSLMAGIGIATWQATEAKAQRGVAEAAASRAMAAVAEATQERTNAKNEAQRADQSALTARDEAQKSAASAALAETEAQRARSEKERADAEAKSAQQETAKARAVTNFLTRIFEVNKVDQVAAAQKRAQPIEDVLRSAAADIPGRFDNQPELRAELLGVAANLLSDLRLNRDAVQARRAKIEALSEMRPLPVVTILRERADAAADEYNLGNAAAAKQQLLALEDTLAKRTDVPSLLIRIDVNRVLAHIAASAFDREAALKHGALATTLAAQHAPNTPSQVNALSSYAYALDLSERIEESRAVYRQSIEIAERSSGANSVEAGVAHLTYGEALATQPGAQPLAITHLKRALEISTPRFGADSYWIARIEDTLARSLSQIGQYQAAMPLFERSQKTFDKLATHIPPETIARNWMKYAEHLMNIGDPEAARLQLTRAHAVVANRPAGRVMLPLLTIRMHTDAGEYAKATALLRKSSDDLAELWPRDSLEHAHILNRLALSYALQGEYAEANKILDDILRRFPDQSGPIGKMQHTTLSISALVKYLQGDVRQAVTLSAPVAALAMAQDKDKRFPTLTHAILLRHAVFLKEAGQCANALPLLAETTQIASQLAMHSHLRTQSIALHRQCLQALGQQDVANALPPAKPESELLNPGVPKHFALGIVASHRPLISQVESTVRPK